MLMRCSDCSSEMKKTKIEFYCPICGLSCDLIDFEHVCDFDQYGYGVPVFPFEANIPQTKKAYFWKNGKMILMIGPRKRSYDIAS